MIESSAAQSDRGFTHRRQSDALEVTVQRTRIILFILGREQIGRESRADALKNRNDTEKLIKK